MLAIGEMNFMGPGSRSGLGREKKSCFILRRGSRREGWEREKLTVERLVRNDWKFFFNTAIYYSFYAIINSKQYRGLHTLGFTYAQHPFRTFSTYVRTSFPDNNIRTTM